MTDFNAEFVKKIYKGKFDDEALEYLDSLDIIPCSKFLIRKKNMIYHSKYSLCYSNKIFIYKLI